MNEPFRLQTLIDFGSHGVAMYFYKKARWALLEIGLRFRPIDLLPTILLKFVPFAYSPIAPSDHCSLKRSILTNKPLSRHPVIPVSAHPLK